MKKKDLVWRELVDAAVTREQRRWENVDDLAFRAGVAPTTAAYALRRLIEIGAVRQRHAGFTVVNPEKVLTSFCASRSLVADAVAVVSTGEPGLHALINSTALSGFVLGGPEAAIALLGGVNTVSDYKQRVVYLRDEVAKEAVDSWLDHASLFGRTDLDREGGSITFLLADKRAARTWGSHTSFAQTYADLFATPGWQASEFRIALHDKLFGKRDWDQE